MRPITLSQLYPRLIVGTILTIVVLLAIYISQLGALAAVFASFLAVAVACAQWEYYQMAQVKGHQPFVALGLCTSIVYLLAVFLTVLYPSLKPLSEVVLLLALLIFFLMTFIPRPDPLVNVALTLFGVGYLALPLGTILAIAYFPFLSNTQDPRWWLFYLYAVTKMTDVGALAIGKLFGKHPLALRISPNKTIEGAFGGFCVTVLTSLLFALAGSEGFGWISLHLSIPQAFVLGALIGIVGQLGDLSESVLKRDANVKHSSRLPGLGGALDIVDSLIFTAPLLYFFLEWSFR
jgi:phosphatidate cytidylyltransferase